MAPTQPLTAWLCLAYIGVVGLESVIFGRRRHRRFAGLQASELRQAYLRGRVAWSVLRYGGGAFLGLLCLGDGPGALGLTPALEGVRRQAFQLLPSLEPSDRDLITAMLTAGLLCGIAVAGVSVSVMLKLRGRSSPVLMGDIAVLIPRNGAERRLCVLLSLNAGVSEELFFRAFVPAAVLSATGSVALALTASILVFALSHAYQGWVGVLATAAAGAIFLFTCLLSGGLIAAMALHALVDLRTLVFEPWLAQRVVRRSSDHLALADNAGAEPRRTEPPCGP